MGVYWKPVNLTREEFIHPHHVGCGLKLGEWNHPHSAVRQLMKKRWRMTDDVVAVSDAGTHQQISGRHTASSVDVPDYDQIEEGFVEIFLEGGPLGEEW